MHDLTTYQFFFSYCNTLTENKLWGSGGGGKENVAGVGNSQGSYDTLVFHMYNFQLFSY